MPFNVTIILRDRRANGVGKAEVHDRAEAVRTCDDHFATHPEGYVELVFEERTRYAFYRSQAESQINAAL